MRSDSAPRTRVADVDVPYSTPALRALVAFCARVGADTPASLRGYRARVESEIALLLRTGDDHNATERVLQVEQVHSDVDWRTSGAVE